VQRLIGIEEYSGSRPKTNQESEQDNDDGREAGVAFEPLISVF
jgi:hypothetical protein